MSQMLLSSLNREVLGDFSFFLHKINERNLFTRGLVPAYEAPSAALGPEVEYFSSQITLDDRMQYIMRHIVTDPSLSLDDKIGNTVISHFYGARGIHQAISGFQDPAASNISFTTLAAEQKTHEVGPYTRHLRETIERAKKKKVPLWGTTELHTSIQDSGHKHVDMIYGPGNRTSLAVAEWIASWINTGFTQKIAVATSLREMYDLLRTQRGIGAYYGYHCATSNSVNPKLNFHHDEPFCSPGPGAIMTLDLLFPGVDKKSVPYGDRVIWIRENQTELFPGLRETFHPDTFNVTAHGIKVFERDQNELTVYGTEIACCQYAVYCRLRDNPHLVARRKIARAPVLASTEVALSQFFK